MLNGGDDHDDHDENITTIMLNVLLLLVNALLYFIFQIVTSACLSTVINLLPFTIVTVVPLRIDFKQVSTEQTAKEFDEKTQSTEYTENNNLPVTNTIENVVSVSQQNDRLRP